MLIHVTLATISPALVGAIVVILLGGAWVVYAYRKPRTGQAARIQPDGTTPSPTTRPVTEQQGAPSLDVQRRLSDFTPDSEPQVERWFRDRQAPPAAAMPAEDSGIVVLHPSNPALAEAARRNGTTGAAEPVIVRTEPIPIRPVATPQPVTEPASPRQDATAPKAAEPVSLRPVAAPPDAAQPAGLSAASEDDDYDYVDHSELSTGPLGALPPAPKRD